MENKKSRQERAAISDKWRMIEMLGESMRHVGEILMALTLAKVFLC